MAPRRPSSARRTGEILAPTDTTGGAAPVYETDGRTTTTASAAAPATLLPADTVVGW